MKEDSYISTREAATLLGVALGTVQRMVDGGELQAWTTAGGHRRINRESVMRALESGSQVSRRKPLPGAKCELDLVLANSRAGETRLLQNTVDQWGLPLRTAAAENELEIAVLCATQRARMVLMQMDEPKADDIATLRKLMVLLKAQRTVLAVVTGRASYSDVSTTITQLGAEVFADTPGLDELKGFVRARLIPA